MMVVKWGKLMTLLTQDQLLDGKVTLAQPAEGYRAAIDPVFLAAAVAVKAGQRVLDVGCGVGAASLCLAARVAACRVVGMEIQPALLSLAWDNAATNGVDDRVHFIQGDLSDPPAAVVAGGFDHVMTNPPYMDNGTHSPHEGKAAANHEGELSLNDWVRNCLALLAHKGTLTMIHRADRLDDLMAALQGRAGDIAVWPLWPKRGRPAKRILVRARKGVRSPTQLLAGMVLHGDDGRYTPAAETVLRLGGGIEWAL